MREKQRQAREVSGTGANHSRANGRGQYVSRNRLQRNTPPERIMKNAFN